MCNIQDAYLIIERLRNVGVYSFIAGGYVRDMALNRVPKDIDIMVCSQDFKLVESVLFNMCYKVYHHYYNESCTADTGDHFIGCIKLDQSGIDLVLCKAGYDNPAAIVNSFDNFTCMFFMQGDTPVYLGGVVGKYPHFANNTRGDKQRAIYLENSDFFTL